MIRLLWTSLWMCAALTAQGQEIPHSQSVMQVTAALDALDREAQRGDYAGLERAQARQAVNRLPEVRTRDQALALDEAQVLLKTAEYAVKSGQLKDQLVQLDREHDAILVEASRRDALLARKEAEQLRLQALAREEEQLLIAELESGATPTPNKQAPTAADEQAKRLAEAKAKEAELARLEEELSVQMNATADGYLRSRVVAGKTVYILSAVGFTPGKATLTADAKEALRTLAKKLRSTGKNWSIEGHLDAVGDEALNLQLSRKRADAVLTVLKSAGVSPGKLSAKGLGSGKPVASNQSKSGRAQNRRVEIVEK